MEEDEEEDDYFSVDSANIPLSANSRRRYWTIPGMLQVLSLTVKRRMKRNTIRRYVSIGNCFQLSIQCCIILPIQCLQ